MKFLFLALAIAPLLLPLIFQLDKKIFINGNFKMMFGGSLVSCIVFSALLLVQYLLGIITYNTPEATFRDIPIAQYLIIFTFSLVGVSLYQYLNLKFPKNDLQKYSLAVSNLLLGLCVAFLFFAYNKWYTLSTFATLLVLLLLIEYVGKLRFMYKAYRAFLVILVLFQIIYTVLFWNDIITLNNAHISGMRVLKVPIENHFTLLAIILVGVYMFEFFKSKRAA
ncbi:MAG: hypothetical protein EOO47_11130 [Flavobacterium sp.]|nr:MAG: hypothetical protein EOO47_11130 [Flavobacterium sp.]